MTIKSILTLFITLLTAGAALNIYTNLAGAASEQTPNLVALPAEDIQIEDNGDTQLLRFSTTSWNNGLGPMELFSTGINQETNKEKVYQRLYLDDGSTTDRFVGEFVWHESHNHFHFEGYANYTLQPVDAPGASERTGSKVSFCLLDTERIDHKLPGAPKRPQYTSCTNDVQGISVGWGDEYGYDLPGQEIDITGLPDGDYNLTIEIDPNDNLKETSESDNTSTVPVRIENGNASIIDDGSSDGPGNGNGGNNGQGPNN